MVKKIPIVGVLIIVSFLLLTFATPSVYAVSCQITALDVSPTIGAFGTVFNITASGTCDTGVRAIRIWVDGNIIYELGSPTVTATWDSTGAPAGFHTVTAEVAGWGDDTWSSSATSSTEITVEEPDCSITSANISPTNGPVGTVFNISGTASCTNTNVRAMRALIDGNIIYEIGSVSLNTTWDSTGAAEGNHLLTIEAAADGDGGTWAYAASTEIFFYVGAAAPTATFTPDPNYPNCSINEFTVSPPTGIPGTAFQIFGKGSCDRGVRAIRFGVNGRIINEIGAPSHSFSWTSPSGKARTYTITVEVAGQGDDTWTYAAKRSMTVTTCFGGCQPTPTPIPPTDMPPTSIPDPTATSPFDGLPFFCSYTPPNGKWVKVVAPLGLSVRSGPSINYPRVGRANYGTYCEWISTDASTGWHNVRSNGRTGWMSGGSQYTQVGGSNSSPTEAPTVVIPISTPTPRPVIFTCVNGVKFGFDKYDENDPGHNYVEFRVPTSIQATWMNVVLFHQIPVPLMTLWGPPNEDGIAQAGIPYPDWIDAQIGIPIPLPGGLNLFLPLPSQGVPGFRPSDFAICTRPQLPF
jgi:uncharacterized protein YraI